MHHVFIFPFKPRGQSHAVWGACVCVVCVEWLLEQGVAWRPQGSGMHPAGAFKGKTGWGRSSDRGSAYGAALQQSLPACSEQPLAVGLDPRLQPASSLPSPPWASWRESV